MVKIPGVRRLNNVAIQTCVEHRSDSNKRSDYIAISFFLYFFSPLTSLENIKCAIDGE